MNLIKTGRQKNNNTLTPTDPIKIKGSRLQSLRHLKIELLHKFRYNSMHNIFIYYLQFEYNLRLSNYPSDYYFFLVIKVQSIFTVSTVFKLTSPAISLALKTHEIQRMNVPNAIKTIQKLKTFVLFAQGFKSFDQQENAFCISGNVDIKRVSNCGAIVQMRWR